MQDVEVALESETLSELDELAAEQYDGDRDAAVRDLLSDWVVHRDEASQSES